jgi:hypothetical protein
VYDLSSSSFSSRTVSLGKSIPHPQCMVSCNDTNRLYIADCFGCVLLVDYSSVGRSLEPVRFVEVEHYSRVSLSTLSQQLLITHGHYRKECSVLNLFDVNGRLRHRVELMRDVIKCEVSGAVMTTRDTFYVCGRLIQSSQYDIYSNDYHKATVSRQRVLNVLTE